LLHFLLLLDLNEAMGGMVLVDDSPFDKDGEGIDWEYVEAQQMFTLAATMRRYLHCVHNWLKKQIKTSSATSSL
jgi:hypothetical protein